MFNPVHGETYVVIDSIKNGKIKTKEVVFDEELTDFERAEIRYVMTNGKEYNTWDVFKTREDAIKENLKDIKAIIKENLKDIKATIKALNNENKKLLKTIEDNKKRIAEIEKDLELYTNNLEE